MAVVSQMVRIDASGLHYRELNALVRQAVKNGARRIVLADVTGQRYIGTNLHGAAEAEVLTGVEIDIQGTPGSDLGVFLDGPTITVYGNVMDGTGNTMNRGRIVVHGRAGDITGFSARGGEIYIKENAGYRVGIHMKEYNQMRPVLVIGGTTQDFLGEYLAGGVIIVMCLTLKPGEQYCGSHIGTGMHGGVIYIRSPIEDHQIGLGVARAEITDHDSEFLCRHVQEYARLFDSDVSNVEPKEFTKLVPLSTRPYKQVYAY